MNWKILALCALFFAALPFVQAADPISYREISMLLRNGEDQQFILNDIARRKLLQPLSEEEAQTLLSLHASPALMNLLRDPATLASAQTTAAYAARLEQQKAQALRDEQLAAQARFQQQQQQVQLLAKAGATPAPTGPGAAYLGKPFGLKFNAADGSPFDLEKLHGKVVLLDFWATWCGPCMQEVPNVVAAYAKYHDKGFEIVGISLDKSKASMLRVAAQKGMTWTQYFDGKGWDNEISTRLGIPSIPTMWLISKNGIVATTQARGHLDTEVARLLAE